MPADISQAGPRSRQFLLLIFGAGLLFLLALCWQRLASFFEKKFSEKAEVMLTMKDSEISSDFAPKMKVYFFGEEVGELEKVPFYFRESDSKADWILLGKYKEKITPKTKGLFGAKIRIRKDIYDQIRPGWKAVIKRELFLTGDSAIHLYPGMPSTENADSAKSSPGELPIESGTLDGLVRDLDLKSKEVKADEILKIASVKLAEIDTKQISDNANKALQTLDENLKGLKLTETSNNVNKLVAGFQADAPVMRDVSDAIEKIQKFAEAAKSASGGVDDGLKKIGTSSVVSFLFPDRFKPKENALQSLRQHQEWRQLSNEPDVIARRYAERPNDFPPNLPPLVTVWYFRKSGGDEFFVQTDTGQVWMRSKNAGKDGPAKVLTVNSVD